MKRKLILVLLLSVISINVFSSIGNFTYEKEPPVIFKSLGTDDDAAT